MKTAYICHGTYYACDSRHAKVSALMLMVMENTMAITARPFDDADLSWHN